MEYRNLGKSGLMVSALSFGSWVSFHKQINDNVADQLMGMAYDAGINFFDNAEIYARGESELMMGRVIKNKKWERSSYIISSKAYFGWRGPDQKPTQKGLSRKHLTEACHEALQRFNTDYLDLYYCHRPDKQVPIEEICWTMHQLFLQGKIMYWGTSEWSATEIMEAYHFAAVNHTLPPTTEQPQYNLFERDKIEKEYLNLLKNKGLGTTIWSPLCSGLLSGKYLNGNIPPDSRLAIEGMEWLKDSTLQASRLPIVQQLAELANQLGVSLACLSIAWCLKNPHVSTAILGATKPEQLTENLKALNVLPLLSPEIMEKLDAITQTKPIQPLY